MLIPRYYRLALGSASVYNLGGRFLVDQCLTWALFRVACGEGLKMRVTRWLIIFDSIFT